jgi:serine/threonine-protein kinase
MGQVWAARQTGRLGLPKLVAIKTAIPIASKDYRQVEKYLFDEAHVAASIDHPNVCKILELGEERDVLFIAMEWLNGVPLSTLVSKLPQRRLEYRMAAHLVAQACSGLHAAHELTDDDGVHLEVVHRDATPHNFMITSMGELKVMDFGIVKAKNQQHQATQTGELKGKISYLTPEQIRGGDVDRRTDIFTLGCVLYVITVGRVAFNPETDQDVGRTILRIINGEYVQPSSVLSDYPPELEAIVGRALATAPADRFQTAEEMRLALEAFLGDGSRSVTREDVAALVHEYCGSGVEQRRWEIRSAQKLFDSQSGEMRSGSYPVAERDHAIGPSVTTGSQSNSGNASQWLHSSPGAPTARPSIGSRKLLWAIVGGAALVLASLGAYVLGQLQPEEAQNTEANAVGPALVRAQANTANEQPEVHPQGIAPAAQPLTPKNDPREPADMASSTSKSSRRGGFRGATKVAAAPAGASAVVGEAGPAPNSPNTQFTQSLARKPPRHAIDESDPFEK